MKYIITKITTETVEFSSNIETYKVPQREIDYFAYLEIGDEFDIDGEFSVPYSISEQRRADIREHHAEEARCGNI